MFIIFIFLILFNSALFSYDNSDSLKFLLLPVNASSLGSGGISATGSVGNEYFNPAMMIEAKNKMLELSYLKWVENINLGYIGFVYPEELKGMTFGGGVTYLNTEDIPSYDEEGEFLGNSSVSNWLAGFSFSKKIVDNDLFKSAFGFGFKVLSVNLMGETGNGVGFNSGFYFSFRSRIILGLSVRNSGSGIKLNDKVNDLPQVVSGVLSYKGDSFSLYIGKDDEILKTGVEFSLTDQISLRGGYRSLTDLGSGAGITLGIGFKESISQSYLYNILAYFDYALCSFGDLGFVHIFSLGIKF